MIKLQLEESKIGLVSKRNASILGTDKALGMEFSKIIAYPKRSLYFINLNRLVQQAILLQLLP